MTAVAHSSSDSAGRQRVITSPTDVLVQVPDLADWLGGGTHDAHPLLRWHTTTNDPRPTTIGRVPTAMVPNRERGHILSRLRSLGIEQQVAISYRLSGRSHYAYVLGRTATDFTDDDLVVARWVQRALLGLDRQIALLQRLTGGSAMAFDIGLTGRETTVLGLLTAGLSTRLIGRRLGCSPRTVDKHCERIFRKLGVRDRLNAVRVAQQWVLRSEPGSGSESHP